MGKYYYTIIQTMNDNTQAMSVVAKDTHDEALASLHYDQLIGCPLLEMLLVLASDDYSNEVGTYI